MSEKRRYKYRSLRIVLSGNRHRQAFLDAAYGIMKFAWVRVELNAGKMSVVLKPKNNSFGFGLREKFAHKFEKARLQRITSLSDRRQEEKIMSHALALADRLDVRLRQPEPALPAERLEEIERLVAEHEAIGNRFPSIIIPWEELGRSSSE
jgi:hypothetical protein